MTILIFILGVILSLMLIDHLFPQRHRYSHYIYTISGNHKLFYTTTTIDNLDEMRHIIHTCANEDEYLYFDHPTKLATRIRSSMIESIETKYDGKVGRFGR